MGQADPVAELARLWRESRHVVVLTGAGVSTESGLPDFRSRAGIWQGIDPFRVASLTALRRDPVAFYRFYRQRLRHLAGARPNPAHRALAALEAAGRLACLITQNVDRLHQAAGHRDVVELHGNLAEAHCLECGARYPIERVDVEVESPDQVPRCDGCGGVLKPAVVLFEEVLPAAATARAFAEARRCDLFVVVGSSLEVGPANLLPEEAVAAGARLAIVNLDPTHLDGEAQVVVRGKAGQVLPAVAAALGVPVPPGEGEG